MHIFPGGGDRGRHQSCQKPRRSESQKCQCVKTHCVVISDCFFPFNCKKYVGYLVKRKGNCSRDHLKDVSRMLKEYFLCVTVSSLFKHRYVNLPRIDPCMFTTNTKVGIRGSSKQPVYLDVNRKTPCFLMTSSPAAMSLLW